MVCSCCAATGSSICASIYNIQLDGELLVRLCIWLQALVSDLKIHAGNHQVMPCTTGLSRLNKFWLQDAIRRVQDLEKMGHLSGVMDDRGKVSQHLFWLQLHAVTVHNPMSQ